MAIKEIYINFCSVLKSLHIVLARFDVIRKKQAESPESFDDYEEYRIHRDSAIQRFEYSIDLFWKYIKAYLETKQLISGPKIPADVVRTASANNIITEEEAEAILSMIKSRNLTSHMYLEELAEQLVAQLDRYYTILYSLVTRLT
jgi:nucleotidyltransferase substrate binding protein (TIGR01987 family)